MTLFIVNFFGRPSFARTCVRWALALGLLVGTVPGMRLHADRLRDMQEQGLPLAADLVPLDRRLQLLRAEAELAQVQKDLRSGSRKEQLHTFVLPDHLDRSRIVGFLDALQATLGAQNSVVQVGTAGEPDATSGLASASVTWTLRVPADKVASMSAFLHLAGLMTVADALPASGVHDLLGALEHTRPADIAALEQFLALDLHAYAQQPELQEQRLLGSVESASFHDVFRGTIRGSLLSQAVTLLQSERGKELLSRGMWPSPFLSIKGMSLRPLADGQQEVMVEMETYIRK